MNKKILIVGDMMLDIYHSGQVTRMSPEAPVPILHITAPDRCIPGGACNVAMNVSASGHTVYLAGITGIDENGDTLISLLKQAGIDCSLVQRADTDTITKARFITDRSQQLIRVDTEDPDDIEAHADHHHMLDAIEAVLPDVSLIIISDYLKGLLTADFTQSLIRLASDHGLKTLIDVKDPVTDKYTGAWLLKPNRSELGYMTHMPVATPDEIADAAGRLRAETGCEYVLTTCGADGMVLTAGEGSHHIPAYGQDVYDITGAGDTVIAYLAAGLADGMNIREAAELANRAAGIGVSRQGTATVSRQELTDKHIADTRETAVLPAIASSDRTVVFTNGCFDILHVGHKRYLEQARALGDRLIVGVNSDASVRRLKGPDRPINTAADRIEMLSALKCVDEVIIFDEDTPYELIDRLRPDIIVKGGDYSIDEVVGRDIVESYGGRVEIIPYVEDRSTTAIIERISHGEKQ